MTDYSLYDLHQFIRQVVALNFHEAIWLTAEIAQLDLSKGICYLNLVQKEEATDKIIAQANGIIWARQLAQFKRKLGTTFNQILQEGTEVKLHINIDFHERFGLKLIVEDIDLSYTIGKLALQRQLAVQELEQQQLLHKNAQLSLPSVLQRIAVISSENAAGLQDYLNQLQTNAYGYDFQNALFPAAVQGERVLKDVLRQLKIIDLRQAEFDVVVIIRGGGSRLDLAAFDQLELCKAVAEFPLPVLVGIGHETDESLLDLVAHQSLKTPTAVAEFLVRRNLHFEGQLQYWFQELQYLSQSTLHHANSQLNEYQQIIHLASQQLIQTNRQQIDFYQQQLKNNTEQYVHLQKTQLHFLEKAVELLTPTATLKRGFSIIHKGGNAIDKASQLKEGDIIDIQFSEGTSTGKIIK